MGDRKTIYIECWNHEYYITKLNTWYKRVTKGNKTSMHIFSNNKASYIGRSSGRIFEIDRMKSPDLTLLLFTKYFGSVYEK